MGVFTRVENTGEHDATQMCPPCRQPLHYKVLPGGARGNRSQFQLPTVHYCPLPRLENLLALAPVFAYLFTRTLALFPFHSKHLHILSLVDFGFYNIKRGLLESASVVSLTNY